MSPSPQNNLYIPEFFSRSEFTKCNPACRLEDMDSDFLKKLDALRRACGFPLVLSSAFRTPEYEHKKGRSGTSWHCRGRAVDIYCSNSYRRFDIVQRAMALGFNGIGVANTFVHLDDRLICTMWTY